MRRTVFTVCVTFFLTVLLSVGIIGAGAVYYVGGYFTDMTFRRGIPGDPKAPPAVFRTVFVSNGGALRPAAKPRSFATEERWSIRSFDGLKLVATHFAPREESDRWVIVVHGYGMSQAYTWNYAEAYLAAGYHVLTPDMRASGGSEGRYLTMGALESRDIADWSAQIASQQPMSRIALHGISMGAAAVLLAGARPLPSQVRAIVEDAGYTDLYGLLDLQMQKLFDLPGFPLLDMADIMCRQRAGFSFSQVEPVRAVREARLPVMFIHGGGDLLIPSAMEKELFRACRSEKAELVIPKATHAAAYLHRDYYPAVFRFLDKCSCTVRKQATENKR